MRKLELIIAALLVLSPFAANAVPVVVGDNEWMQPLETTNTSWNDIAAVCDPISGTCTGSLGTVDLSGWTWASSSDVGDLLFSVLTPHPGGGGFNIPGANYSEPDSTWAPAFLAMFAPTLAGIDPLVGPFAFVSGLSADLCFQFDCLTPFVQDLPTGEDDSAYTSIISYSGLDTHDPYIGGWFYRAAEVPEPGTFALLGLGLAGMGLTRRRKKV